MPKHSSTIQPGPSRKVAWFRLARHHLLDAKTADAVAISRDVCGIQAQVGSAAQMALWARNHGLRRTEIEAALWQKRSLVKTSLMRQTLHLIPADEFSLYTTALKSSRVSGALRIMARFGITREEAAEVTTVIMDSLASGALGRTAIRAAVRPKVSKRVRAWMERVWSIVRIPIAEGRLCYGPGEGNEVKFIRVEEWLPRQKRIAETEARCLLFRKYLKAYGPATLTDFSHWSGMPMSEVRPLPALLAEELAEIEVDKRKCLLLRVDIQALESSVERKSCVRLLPHFDPYLLAHREKDHLLEAKHYKRVYRNQGWISPVVLVEGSVAGTWSYRLKGKRLLVTVEPFAKPSRAVRSEIAQEAESLAGFLESALELSI